MKAEMLPNRLTTRDQERCPSSRRQMLRYRLKMMKLKEYQKLRTMVPRIAGKPYVSKVTVIEEAVKYIDQLHAAVVMKLRAKQLPVEMLSNTTRNFLKISLATGDVTQNAPEDLTSQRLVDDDSPVLCSRRQSEPLHPVFDSRNCGSRVLRQEDETHFEPATKNNEQRDSCASSLGAGVISRDSTGRSCRNRL